VFTVQYELDPATAVLVLVGRGGERYTADVVATATDPGGGDVVNATALFDPIGWTEGFTAADLDKLDRCMARRFQEVRIRPRDWLVPPDRNPERQRAVDRINEARLRIMIAAIAQRYPNEARDLADMAATRYGSIR
jgi:hypothetical protein